MESSIARILVETTVRQTLRGLREDPERSLRNLIDMGLEFSQGRLQSRFFETARLWMKNEESAYYGLIQDAACHIEAEHLITLGMNVGYNGCTRGAGTIRANEKRLGFHIPWTVFLQIDPARYPEHRAQYDSAVAEGEGLGIRCWMLLAHSGLPALCSLIAEHPDSAFFLFCRPEAVTASALERLAPLRQLMLVVRWGGKAGKACALLRRARLPYCAGLAAQGPGGVHDRGRRQRRARPEGGGYRLRYGGHRHGRREGSVRHDADRRQLFPPSSTPCARAGESTPTSARL